MQHWVKAVFNSSGKTNDARMEARGAQRSGPRYQACSAGQPTCHCRPIVGWSMADHMRTELVSDALLMALARRRPEPGWVVVRGWVG